MPKDVSIRLRPEFLHDAVQIRKRAARRAKVPPRIISHWEIIRRSVDARQKDPVFVLQVRLWLGEEKMEKGEPGAFVGKDVSDQKPIWIVGLGPAGLFAALEAIRLGRKPIVIERGKAVRERRRDLAKITKEGIVNPDSNYCFGEGGAGTFSDGKLYTRSHKRGDVRQILEMLVQFGATKEILIDAHPHIGTNKLPGIIQNIRQAIIDCGGEIHFNSRLTGLEVSNGQLKSITVNGNERHQTDRLVLATGHSARDIFELLDREGIRIEAKAFALGVRVEHPQHLIDKIQYHHAPRQENLPAAAYSLVRQVDNKGVYSFCMCPGGIICPAATANDEVVVNGWSPSKRNSPYANSGIVVEVGLKDLKGQGRGVMAALDFQRSVEQKAFAAGGGEQKAPAQRLMDFVSGKASADLPDCSYLPGLTSVALKEVLPGFVHKRLVGGFRFFGKALKGYLTNEAVVVGVESRTSSPIRIPRSVETGMHPQVEGLIPCGEGAGYAGGIMSPPLVGKVWRCHSYSSKGASW
ncbi:MAG: FAD-dependent protein, partial [Bacteroidota bacterium]